MADTKAIQLIEESIKELKRIVAPPDDYNLDVTEAYVSQCDKVNVIRCLKFKYKDDNGPDIILNDSWFPFSHNTNMQQSTLETYRLRYRNSL